MNRLKTATPADRRFVPASFTVTNPEEVRSLYQSLLDRPIQSVAELERWMEDVSEWEAVLDEDMAWRYIRMTCNTQDAALVEAYDFFVDAIFPVIAPLQDQLNRNLLNSPFLDQLDSEVYFTLLRSARQEVALYREENIPIQAELKKLESKYGQIASAMTIEWEGSEMTMQQAAQLLKSTDRSQREAVFHKIQKRRQQDEEALDALLSDMIRLRHQMALNAGFANYRDYRFAELGRYDYSAADCEAFQKAVETRVMPLISKLTDDRRQKMGLDALMPWDFQVEADGKPALKPFENGDDLLEKTIVAFTNIDPYFGDCLHTMKELGHFDLESRKGKAPGGYNYPLLETGAPFIFMNATSDFHDLETMVHEGGHAIHSFLTQGLRLKAFKNTPMEIAEVASMAMELLSMEQWQLFFPNPDDLKRAKEKQIQQTITLLNWIAAVDQFQHWLYLNPEHSVEDRRAQWKTIFSRYTSSESGWQQFPEYVHLQWQKQLHIFEVPFYYIEYGIAQLGSLGVWKNYCENREKGLEGYKKALSMGYTRPLPEIYAAAGVPFDFSEGTIESLMQFVDKQLKSL